MSSSRRERDVFSSGTGVCGDAITGNGAGEEVSGVSGEFWILLVKLVDGRRLDLSFGVETLGDGEDGVVLRPRRRREKVAVIGS